MPVAATASVCMTTLCFWAILAMSAMGSMVPISLLASMTLMRMVSGVMAFSTSAGSTRPYLVHVQGGDAVVQEAQGAQRIQDRLVLDVGGDDVAALLPQADGDALDGMVDGLGAAGVKDHLFGFGVDQGGHLGPGLLQGLRRPVAPPGCRWRGCRKTVLMWWIIASLTRGWRGVADRWSR